MEKISHHQALERVKPEQDQNIYRISRMMEVLQKLQDSERKNEELLTQIIVLKEQVTENAVLKMAAAENATLKKLADRNKDLMRQVSKKVAENAALREGVVVYSMVSKELKQQLSNATSELWQTRDESKSKHAALLEVNKTLERQLRTATLQLNQIHKKMYHRLSRGATGSTHVEVEVDKELEDLKIQIREMGEEMKCSYIKDKVRVQQTENLKKQLWKLEEKMCSLQRDSLKKEVKLEEGVKLLNQQITVLQELVMRTDAEMSKFDKVKQELKEKKKLEKEDNLGSEEEREFSALVAEIEALREQVSEKEAEILYRDVWIQTFRNNLNFSHSALHQLMEDRKQLVDTTSATHTEMKREIEDLKTMVNKEEDVPLQHHENLENGWEDHHEDLKETCEKEVKCSFLEEETLVQKTEDLKNQIKELEEEISALQEDSLLKKSHLEEEVQLLNQFEELVFRTDEYKVELEQVKQELEERRKQETEKQLEREKKELEMSALAAECGALKELLLKREEEIKYQDAWIRTFRKDLSLSNSTLHQLIEERKHLVDTTMPTEIERTMEDLDEMLKEEFRSADFQPQHQEDLTLENGWGVSSEETSEEEMLTSRCVEDDAQSVHRTEDLKIHVRESEAQRSDVEEDPRAESMLEKGVTVLNQQIMKLQELVLTSNLDVPESNNMKLEPRENIKQEMEDHSEGEVEKEFSALADEIEALRKQLLERDAEIVYQDDWIKTFRSNLNLSNSALQELLEERKHLMEEENARQTEMEREIEDLKMGTTEEEFLLALQFPYQKNPVMQNGWQMNASKGVQETSEKEEMRTGCVKQEPNKVQQTKHLENHIKELAEMSAQQEDSLRRQSKLEEEVQILNQQNMDLQELVCRAGEEIEALEKVKLELEERKKQEMEISTLALEIEALRDKLSKREEEIKYQDAWIQSLSKELNLSNSALHQLVQTARQAETEKVMKDLRTMVREEEEDHQLPHQENGWKMKSDGLQEIPEQMKCGVLKGKPQQTGNVRNQIRKLEEMSALKKESKLEDRVKLFNQQIMELQELVRRSDEYKAELEAVKLELEEKKKQEMEEQLERERKEEEMSVLVSEIEGLREQLSKREEELKDQDAWIQTFKKNLSFSNSTLHHLIEERKHLEEMTRQTDTESTNKDLKMEVKDESLCVDLQVQHQENMMSEIGSKLKCERKQETSNDGMRSSVLKDEPSVQQTIHLKNQIKELEEEMSALQEDSLKRESKLEEEVKLLNQQIMELQELVFMADEYKVELERVKTELEKGKKNQEKKEQLEVEKKEEQDLSALAAEIKALKEQVSEKETEIEYQDVWIKTFRRNLNLCNETLQQLVRERKHLVETASTRQMEMKREIEGLKMMLREREGQIPLGTSPQPQHQEDKEETKGTRPQNLDREVNHFRFMDWFGKTGPPPFPDLTYRGDEEKEPREKKRKWETKELREPQRNIKELRQRLDRKMEEQERKRMERERKMEGEREGNKPVMIVAPSFAK